MRPATRDRLHSAYGRNAPGAFHVCNLEQVAPLLVADERSGCVELDLSHRAPSPPGATVTVTARGCRTTGRFVDSRQELIVSACHKRAAIRGEVLTDRMAQKIGAA